MVKHFDWHSGQPITHGYIEYLISVTKIRIAGTERSIEMAAELHMEDSDIAVALQKEMSELKETLTTYENAASNPRYK